MRPRMSGLLARSAGRLPWGGVSSFGRASTAPAFDIGCLDCDRHLVLGPIEVKDTALRRAHGRPAGDLAAYDGKRAFAISRPTRHCTDDKAFEGLPSVAPRMSKGWAWQVNRKSAPIVRQAF